MSARQFILPIVLFAFGCGVQRDVVQEGRFQKRTHQGGWHVDLHKKTSENDRTATRLRHIKVGSIVHPSPLIAIDDRLLATTNSGPSLFVSPPSRASDPVCAEELLPVRSTITLQEEDENLMPRKKLNALAIPALVMALVTVGLGFSQNLWLLVGAIVVTLVLVALSMRRIRRYEQGGKGFTFAALMIGVLAALLTALSIARYGIDQW
ncbi:MAG: DUF4190 domain-containing protein [Flavobacteriales bacterium]|nr:DUF4190 domain-containing protein [Flavobacteriales bacterium]